MKQLNTYDTIDVAPKKGDNFNEQNLSQFNPESQSRSLNPEDRSSGLNINLSKGGQK